MTRSTSQLLTFLITATTILLSGCCSMRGMKSEDVAAARDLTYHGLNALHQGDCSRAEHLLQQASQACPQDQRIRQHLANALAEQGKTDNAIRHLESAIEASPHDPRLLVELGKLHLVKDNANRALHCADLALQIDRQAPCAWMLKGECQESLGQWNLALNSFHRAAGLPGVDPAVQINIAKAYRKLDRPIQAMTALNVYHQNFASDKIPVESALLISDTLVELDQVDHAIQTLNAVNSREDATVESWIALSRLQQLSGDRSGAMLTARDAENRFPNHPEIESWIASLPSASGSRTAAVPGRRY